MAEMADVAETSLGPTSLLIFSLIISLQVNSGFFFVFSSLFSSLPTDNTNVANKKCHLG